MLNFKDIKLILFTYIILFEEIVSSFIGTQDVKLCKKEKSPRSCKHQLSPNIRISTECYLESISDNDCPSFYDVNDIFEPKDIPFNLGVYKFKDNFLQTVSINISFPQPKWKNMFFYLKNKYKPDTRKCHRFVLENGEDPATILNTIFWDCLCFFPNVFEKNFFNLYLMNDRKEGGIYTFKMPSVSNYDFEAKQVKSWHVFFFMHQHYLDAHGKPVVTLQPAPFSNISYAISLVKCLKPSIYCEESVALQTIFINQERYLGEASAPMQIELKTVSMPGTYAATVQILSPECHPDKCPTSFSPIFELERDYVMVFPLFFVIVIIVCLSYILLRRKLEMNFYAYTKDWKNTKSVLLIYHAESAEMWKLCQFLSCLFSDKFFLRPLLVDEDVRMQDPNDWTRNQLCHASKILFLVPRNPSLNSATPIQHQWHYALSYFSGTFLKQNQNISSRCASILIPSSMPLVQGNEIYSLPRFRLERDLILIVDWLHRSSLLDRVLFWRPIVKEVSKDLSAFIRSATNPLASLSRESPISDTEKLFDISPVGEEEAWPPSEEASPLSKEGGANEMRQDIVRGEFDPLIPDVSDVVRGNESDWSDESSDESVGGVSVNDVMQFAS